MLVVENRKFEKERYWPYISPKGRRAFFLRCISRNWAFILRCMYVNSLRCVLVQWCGWISQNDKMKLRNLVRRPAFLIGKLDKFLVRYLATSCDFLSEIKRLKARKENHELLAASNNANIATLNPKWRTRLFFPDFFGYITRTLFNLPHFLSRNWKSMMLR